MINQMASLFLFLDIKIVFFIEYADYNLYFKQLLSVYGIKTRFFFTIRLWQFKIQYDCYINNDPLRKLIYAVEIFSTSTGSKKLCYS